MGQPALRQAAEVRLAVQLPMARPAPLGAGSPTYKMQSCGGRGLPLPFPSSVGPHLSPPLNTPAPHSLFPCPHWPPLLLHLSRLVPGLGPQCLAAPSPWNAHAPNLGTTLSFTYFRFLLILIHQLLRGHPVQKYSHPSTTPFSLTGLFFYVFPPDHEGRTASY